MFGRRINWDDYRQDILSFCEVLGAQPWTPSEKAQTFLRGVQRDYYRVGLTGAQDGWRAMAAACLWRACCHPDYLQLVMAGTLKSGQAWMRYLRQVASESTDMVREHLLFTQDDCSIVVKNSQDPVISVLSPGQLVEACRIQGGRPTVLVMPDLDRVPSKWLTSLQSYVAGPTDQWLVVAPVRP